MLKSGPGAPPAYELCDSLYVLKDECGQVLLAAKETGIAYNELNGYSSPMRHGKAEVVRAWAAMARRKLKEAGMSGQEYLKVFVTKTMEPETLNRCLDFKGVLGSVVQGISKEQDQSPSP